MSELYEPGIVVRTGQINTDAGWRIWHAGDQMVRWWGGSTNQAVAVFESGIQAITKEQRP